MAGAIAFGSGQDLAGQFPLQKCRRTCRDATDGKNINELSTLLRRNFHRLRQNSIDEELFDIVAGFNALAR